MMREDAIKMSFHKVRNTEMYIYVKFNVLALSSYKFENLDWREQFPDKRYYVFYSGSCLKLSDLCQVLITFYL